ncbi:hypothetical protein HED60_09390 [Planctomycetales bacterium ZRK34]|nr:hypothetical protein HED60_09390 [Planctomycetales bacterium ZRK34]
MSHDSRIVRWVVVFILAGMAPVCAQDAPELTREQVVAFAKDLALSLNSREAAMFNEAWSNRALFERAVQGIQMPSSVRRGFRLGLDSSGSELSRQIVLHVAKGGIYRLLHVRKIDGHYRALYRMSSLEGLNYHDIVLAPGSDGRVRIIDVEVATTGELVSQSMRHRLLQLVGSTNPRVFKRLSDSENVYLAHLDDMSRMQQAAKNDQYGEALRIYQSLPESLRYDRNVMTLGILFASRISRNEQYLQMISEYIERYPESLNADLIGLDAYYLNKKWGPVLQAINRLDKKLGGDPYLDIFRGNVARELGMNKEAAKLLRRVIADDPRQPDAYYPLIEIMLEQKDWVQVTKLLLALRREAGRDLGDLTRIDTFAGYTKTRYYQNYISHVEIMSAVPTGP